VTRWGTDLAQKAERDDDRRRMRSAIDALRNATKNNVPGLTEMEGMKIGEVMYLPMLDFETWEVVKGEIARLLPDPVLQGRIANHFGAIAGLLKLNDFYTEASTGVAAAMGGSDEKRKYLIDRINKMSKAIKSDGEELDTALQAARGLTPSHRTWWPWSRPDHR